MIYFLLVIVVLLLSFLGQEFVPAIEWAFYARLLLVQSTFFCASVTVPFPVMLLLAAATGFAWDARYYVPIYPEGSSHPEMDFGFTMLLYGLMGSLIQGVRPLFRRGRWELPVFFIGVCTFLSLVIQYLVISFHRGGLNLSTEMFFQMLMISLFSMLAAPLILLLFSRLAKVSGYRIRLEGISRKYSYGDSL